MAPLFITRRQPSAYLFIYSVILTSGTCQQETANQLSSPLLGIPNVDLIARAAYSKTPVTILEDPSSAKDEAHGIVEKDPFGTNEAGQPSPSATRVFGLLVSTDAGPFNSSSFVPTNASRLDRTNAGPSTDTQHRSLTKRTKASSLRVWILEIRRNHQCLDIKLCKLKRTNQPD